MDRSAQVFRESVKLASKSKDSMVALKFSGLCDIETLKQLNRNQEYIINIFDEINNASPVTGQQVTYFYCDSIFISVSNFKI